MAFASITTAEVQPGEPTKSELFTKVKDNDDDLNDRLTVVEAFSAQRLPIEFAIRGQALVVDQADIFRFNFNVTVLSARIFLVESGTSGTLEVDIEKSTDGGGSFSSIFATKPSVSFGDGDYFLSTNQVFLSSPTIFDTGDFMRLNLDSVITDSRFFKVLVEVEGR